ncbi:MAG TPA: glycosyltransferase family 9 protein [Fimbriimonadaceae bacterium]|jgi:ADP-heptose:LPS heptosyltransferase
MGPKILIVRFSAIGDCVMAAPAASVLRRAMPDAFIAWAVDSRCVDVIDTERLVDMRYEIPRKNWKKDHTSWHQQFRHFARLRRFQFDYGLDLQGHSKTAFCLRIAAPKKRWAAKATDVAALLLNPRADIRHKGVHTVERNLQMASLIGDFDVSTEPIMPRLELLPDIPWKPAIGRLATISTSAGHPKKCYSAAAWGEVARLLQQQGFQVAFLGGCGDPSPELPGVMSWVGKLSLGATMRAVANSAVHLAADTGTGHMAAAYGVPVVSVFGYTNQTKYRPYTQNSVLLNAGKSMDGVLPEQIVESVDSIVARQHAFVN